MPSRRLPSLTTLVAFEAFARHGRMTLAAEDLGVTHGAVSRAIRSLEAQLTTKLIVGPRHHIELTDAGRRLAAATRTAFDIIEKALPSTQEPQTLGVVCSTTFAMKWLIPRLPDFLDQHPAADVRLLEEDGPLDFGPGQSNAAIRLEPGAPKAARVLPFLKQHHGPVLSSSLWERCGASGAKALRAGRLYSASYPKSWDIWSQGLGVELPPAAITRSFEHNTHLLEASLAGLGVSIMPWVFVEADVKAGRLIAPWGFQELPYGFVYVRPDVGDHGLASAFGRWLRSQGQKAKTPPPAIGSVEAPHSL